MLIAMAGLPGSGKSTLARALAAALPAALLDKDAVRAVLFVPEDIEYSTEQDDFCLSVMLQAAGHLWRRHPGRRVILDGRPFALRYQRADVADHAARHGVPFRLILCTCSDETARLRLERHVEHPARNRDFALYRALKDAFEPIEGPHLRVDTEQSVQACLDQCLAYIAEGAST